ncbi:Tryptophan synthase beta chain 1, chloroplastic [Morella rubra]|uniref:Tryptophan synthase beta chain 1, chloroplastic n=1 Tax=Morella rubra TaxID=262757 RepID=A0A6A1UIJ3_9ROSI|nr:Tryptophan synthase beta chain 1, chloroplastic [Morella rubra]
MAAATTAPSTPTARITRRASALPKPYPSSSKLSSGFLKVTSPFPSKSAKYSFSVSCTLATPDSRVLQMDNGSNPTLLQRPDSFGRFGKFGGKYVPETLMYALSELESAFQALAGDDKFQVLLVSTGFFHFLF